MWKGIAVLLSTLWFLGLVGHRIWSVDTNRQFYINAMYAGCTLIEERKGRDDPSYLPNLRECEKDREEAMDKPLPIDWAALLVQALAPVAAFWLGAWLVLAIRRRIGGSRS
jgi:hypothetical protein